MIALLGSSSLLASVPVSLAGMLALPFFRKNPILCLKICFYTFASLLVLLLVSLGTLIASYINSDFSLVAVVMNSDISTPLLYKIAGVWGSHEGSMLLWTVFLVGYGCSFSLSLLSKTDSLEELSKAVSIVLGLSFFMIAFVAIESNPFTQVSYYQPTQGRDLNPILQDPVLAVHPPILYLGMSGLSVPCALALAGAVATGSIRYWTTLSWSLMTAGIGLGSYWAYRELGWGGWWFWDPVESVSLIPWLLATAALHFLPISRRSSSLRKMERVLVITSFAACILELLLVRSGLLLSVHSFAEDPRIGIWFFVLLVVILGLSILSMTKDHSRFSNFIPTTYEWIVIAGVGLLAILAFTVAVGVFYPVILKKISGFHVVTSPLYYSSTFIPLASFGLVIVPIASLTKWVLKKPRSRLVYLVLLGLSLAVILGCLIFAHSCVSSSKQAFHFFVLLVLGLWVIGGTFISSFKSPMLIISPMFLSHLGLGLAVSGMVLNGFLSKESSLFLRQGSQQLFQDMSVTLCEIKQIETKSYFSQRATVSVKSSNGEKDELFLYPERRFYPRQEVVTTEVGLHHLGLSDLYVVLGEYQPPDRWLVRISNHPGINLIWIGIILVASGGFSSLFSWKFGARDFFKMVKDIKIAHFF